MTGDDQVICDQCGRIAKLQLDTRPTDEYPAAQVFLCECGHVTWRKQQVQQQQQDQRKSDESKDVSDSVGGQRSLERHEATKRLTTDQAMAKAGECRDMAKSAIDPEHRIMLEHMAETWERIARDLLQNGG